MEIRKSLILFEVIYNLSIVWWHYNVFFLFYVQTWAWCLRKAPSEYWRFFSQENSNTLKVFSLPASKHTKRRGLQQERKWTVEKPFCIQRAQKGLFSATSMMTAVLKDTVRWYFKHRNTHWRDGHTWIHSGKFPFSFSILLCDGFRLFFSPFTVTQRACHCRGYKIWKAFFLTVQ